MKHIKLFEGYTDDKLKEFLENIKSEVDQYMYYILDDLQSDSTTDGIYLTGSKKIFILYNKVSLDLMSVENKNKLLKLSKVIKKEFDMDIIVFECTYSVIHSNSEKSVEDFIKSERFKYTPITSITLKLM